MLARSESVDRRYFKAEFFNTIGRIAVRQVSGAEIKKLTLAQPLGWCRQVPLIGCSPVICAVWRISCRSRILKRKPPGKDYPTCKTRISRCRSGQKQFLWTRNFGINLPLPVQVRIGERFACLSGHACDIAECIGMQVAQYVKLRGPICDWRRRRKLDLPLYLC